MTQGSIYRRPRSPFWWVRYSYQSRTHRESTKEKSRARAREYLDRRLAEIGADMLGLRKFVGPVADRIPMGQMFAALRKDLELRDLRSFAATANHLTPCRGCVRGLAAQGNHDRARRPVDRQATEKGRSRRRR